MYIEVNKVGDNYSVTPDITPPAGGITSINDQIPCFDSNGAILIAVDSQRNIITDIDDIGNVVMLLDVSSGGGNPRTCFRVDDSVEWDPNIQYSVNYFDNCTFSMNDTTLIVSYLQDSYPMTVEYPDIEASASPLSYISVGLVGS